MKIYADPPRKYRKNGKSWSHLSSPDVRALEAYAREHGLKRKDRYPWIHFDVTKEELAKLPGVTHVNRYELARIMNPYRQPRRNNAKTSDRRAGDSQEVV